MRGLGERSEVVEARAPALGVARAQRGKDECLQQPRLAVGRGAERAQVSRRDPVPGKPLARVCDLDVELGVWRLEQPELLELAHARPAHARALAELVEDELVLVVFAEHGRRPSPALLRRTGRELLADDAQRQELVALEPQDRAQPLQVLLREEPVAALGPLRRE